MKIIVNLSRIIVGVLFIISGFIKLNDPVGFAFKLEEYFSQSVLDLPFFLEYALPISITVVIIEVLLGVMLLIGFKVRFTVWSLFLMIVFFTFLTFYSAYFNKVTDCGCFGDALKLTPWESFTKDVVLLVLILILLVGIKHIKPIGNFLFRSGLTLVSLVACIAFAVVVLNHLPSIDFRPYKIGANIEEGMGVPDNAPKAIFEYAWKFNVNGEEQIIVTNGDYPAVEGDFIGVETTEIQKGYEPPIHDFTIEKDGADFAASLLQEPKLVMVIAYDLYKTNREVFSEVKTLTDKALRNHYKVIGMSASSAELTQQLIDEKELNFDFYFTDETTLKTIVRSNPGVLVVEKGTIVQKVHFNDLDNLVFTNDRSQELNLSLKKSLDSVLVLDQKYRANMSMETWGLQMKIDSSNMNYIAKIIEKHGYPGASLVGDKTATAAWYVIQHSNRIPEYINQIEKAALERELPYRLYGMMLDRHLMGQNKPQIYGTQGSSYFMGTPDEVSFIWPVENPEKVNERRKEAGFSDSIEASAKRIFGDDFEYKSMSMEEVNAILKKVNFTE